jgi:hypothetical protein
LVKWGQKYTRAKWNGRKIVRGMKLRNGWGIRRRKYWPKTGGRQEKRKNEANGTEMGGSKVPASPKTNLLNRGGMAKGWDIAWHDG